MHKPIRKFSLDGTVGDDKDFSRLREQYESMLVKGMREEGCVPILGFGPFWSTSYIAGSESYEFVLSVYGTYVGRKRACLVEGISVDGREMLRPIPKSKSNPLSDNAE